jgi:hypothetical protein
MIFCHDDRVADDASASGVGISVTFLYQPKKIGLFNYIISNPPASIPLRLR